MTKVVPTAAISAPPPGDDSSTVLDKRRPVMRERLERAFLVAKRDMVLAVVETLCLVYIGASMMMVIKIQ